MNSERIKLNKILKYGSILFFPLRDAFGFYIGRVPLRFGELWAAFYIIFFVFSSQKINKKEMLLVSILVANLFLTILGLFFNYGKYDQNFAMKYTLRNLLNIVFILGFLFSSISFSADNIKGVMIYSFYVQICAFVLLYVTHHYFYMNKLLGWEDILASGQIVNLLGMKVPRFMGTSSEPGYLASFLPMLLYYFIESNISHKRIYIAITGLMIVATFSTAVYIATIAILVVFFANNGIKKKYLWVFIFAIVVSILLYFFNAKIQVFVDEVFLKKILSMFNGDKVNYSATERNLQIRNAIKVFGLNDFIQILVGRGTGGYLYYTLNFGTGLFSYNVEEAFNLYLSTLVDRGIAGLIILIMLIIFLWKHRIKKDKISNAIFVGISIQLLHWMITGNIWQYYFWMEIVFLLGYYRGVNWQVEERDCLI